MKFDFEKIPASPGCYLYKNSKGEVIYVGKAKILKKRVYSYFNKKDLDSKTKALVSHISDIDFIVTNTEVEALLLEDNLIKKYKPKYNIDLKDSKSYAYIEITSDEYPRLIIARTDIVKKSKKSGRLFGPFVSSDSRNQVLNTVNKAFQLRTCKKLPKKKCLRYDIGICSAPCIKKISHEEYLEDVKKAEMVLGGKGESLVENLKKMMVEKSKELDYERAIKIRDQIKSIDYLREKQSVERQKKYDEDIINYVIKEEMVYVMVFNILKGTLINKKDFSFEYRDGFFEEFILRFYSENKIPKKIILPEKIDPSLGEYLKKIKGQSVEIKLPKTGELKTLLDLVKKNIEIHFFGDIKNLEELKNELELEDLPRIIECFDISHLSGTETVASMVQFRNGKPDKSNYRKFKIKSFQGNDDFRAMNEVVTRRYKKIKNENLEYPDLILIDGGLGQLNSAIKSLSDIGVKIPIISLAKKEEEIYLPDRSIPIRLDRKNKARLLLERIRDEAHRFAVTFQRERRSKRFIGK